MVGVRQFVDTLGTVVNTPVVISVDPRHYVRHRVTAAATAVFRPDAVVPPVGFLRAHVAAVCSHSAAAGANVRLARPDGRARQHTPATVSARFSVVVRVVFTHIRPARHRAGAITRLSRIDLTLPPVRPVRMPVSLLSTSLIGVYG